MYSWIWRRLPGPKPIKAIHALLLVTLVAAFLMLVVFPWLEPQLPWNDVTVNGGG
jgi:hypothetical protein